MRLAEKNFSRKGFLYFLFFLLCYGISFLGGLATERSLDPWYVCLKKASWTPPAWVFGPVWTVLYGMIAVSGALFFQAKKSKARQTVLSLYFAQLFLNGIWSFLFFYFQRPVWALIDLFLLTLFLGATIWAGRGVSRLAAYLLLPYFLWTLYALTLNGAIVYQS